jgi:MFS family permease
VAVHPDTQPRHAHPALFGLLLVPFGMIVGYSDLALAYLLGERGLTTPLIGIVLGYMAMPHAMKLLWAPALDAGTARRTWFLAAVGVGAVAIGLVTLIPPDPFKSLGPVTRLEAVVALLVIAQAAAATSSAAVDSLMAITLPNDKKGAAAGWSMAGNLGATFGGGALIIWISRHVESSAVRALILAAILIATAAPALWLEEAPHERHPAGAAFVALLKDLWATFRSREGWTGLVICLAPVGTGAATKLFGKLASDYIGDAGAREHAVELVNGVMGGIAAAAGCLVGGYLSDRMNRRLLYVIGGLLCAASAVAMGLAPANATTYAAGCLAYQFLAGVCFAAFAAFVLEMIGHGPGVTTKYQLFVGASNVAIGVVATLDGFGEGWGARVFRGEPFAARLGVLGTDALAACVGAAVITAMVFSLRRRPVAA